ncbi:hypothetical protein BCR43DRAFT_413758, partial [Syncephalastrum racemosum]
MLQPCIFPGPSQPKDFSSILQPILDELRILEHRGMRVACADGFVTAQAHLAFVGGDIPAQSKAAGHSGHTHGFGCRFCLQQGCYVDGRYTYPPVKAEEPIPQYRAVDSFKTINEQYAQKMVSPFSDLRIFHGTFFFPIDVMHLIGSNIGRQIHRITQGKYDVETGINPLRLNSSQSRMIDRCIAESRPLIPSTFSGNVKSLSDDGFLRAVDWIHILRFIVPTVIVDSIKDKTCQATLNNIAQISNILCHPQVDTSSISVLHECITYWHQFLLDLTTKSCLHQGVFTINQHFLTHIPKLLHCMGPMHSYSAFSNERIIGEFKARIRSKKSPGKNASNVLVDFAALRR